MELTEKERALLVAMCRNNLSLTKAGEELHYHRNSLKYQAEQLELKTGHDVCTFYGAFNLLLDILWKDDNSCLTQQQLNRR